MTINFPKIQIIILSLLCTSSVLGQKVKLSKADTRFEDLGYSQSVELYQALVEDGYASEALYENLATASYKVADYKSSLRWYDSLYNYSSELSADSYSRYINALRSEGNYDKSVAISQKMLALYPDDSRAQFYTAKTDYLEAITNSKVPDNVENAGINSEFYDFAPAYLDDKGLVISSTRSPKKTFSTTHTWTNDSYSNLYFSKRTSDTTLAPPEKMSLKINKFYNESSAVYSKDGQTVYFTRNNYLRHKPDTDTLGTVLLKIYKAKYKEDKIYEIEELPFNDNNFNTAHPALSPEEDYLYFSSDRPGSLGKSDIYRVAIGSDGSYGEVESIDALTTGDKINTEGRDSFPFITSEGVLVFASDGRPGLGGLDLFYVDLNSASKTVYTFGEPLNSRYDDFGLIYKTSDQTGYFTSNRITDNQGKDDIYRFTGLDIPSYRNLELQAVDLKTGEVVPGAQVKIKDENGVIVKELISTDGTETISDLETNKSYTILITHPEHSFYDNTVNLKADETLVLKLDKNKEERPEDVDLANLLELPVIYFDFDKSNILEESEIELRKVIKILEDYPELRIEIRSHTDSRGNKAYNQQLSQRRVLATKNWLLANGVAANRIETKAYGEEQLANGCDESANCEENKHRKNRRSEFIIIE